jgi:hypothetical protein
VISTPSIPQPHKIKASTVTGTPSDRPRNRGSVPIEGTKTLSITISRPALRPTHVSAMKPSSHPSLSCEVKNVWSCTSTRLGVVRKHKDISVTPLVVLSTSAQGRPLGGASGALAPGADFEGAPKRRSPTGHTLIRSTVAC